MRPAPDRVFGAFAMDLLTRVIPAMTPAYHQGTVGMIASMLAMASEEWDRAASRRVEENGALRELFRSSLEVLDDSALCARIESLAKSDDTDFRVSVLEKSNCELRAALVDLHTAIEKTAGARAREIENQIWRELVKSTERRKFSTAQF